MQKIKIRDQAFATRCEICHQADMFTPEDDCCKRCVDISLPTIPSVRIENTTTAYKNVRPDSFLVFLQNIVVWQSRRLCGHSISQNIYLYALMWLRVAVDIRIVYLIAFGMGFPMFALMFGPELVFEALLFFGCIDLVLTFFALMVRGISRRHVAAKD